MTPGTRAHKVTQKAVAFFSGYALVLIELQWHAARW
jgi:hypothetical protein